MDYIESQLLPNERVVARTARHRVVLILPMLIAVWVALAGFSALIAHAAGGIVALVLFAAALIGGIAWLSYKSADFAVTTSRLILKQ